MISNVEKISDEEEESCSLEAGFGNLNFDDKNANPGTEIQGKCNCGGNLGCFTKKNAMRFYYIRLMKITDHFKNKIKVITTKK